MSEEDIEFGVADASVSAANPGEFEVRRAGVALDSGPAPRGGQLESPTLAELYMKQGHYQEAARIWANLLAKRPGDAAILARLSTCQQMMGGTPAAPAAKPAKTAAAIPAPAAGNKTALLATLERWLANARRLQGVG